MADALHAPCGCARLQGAFAAPRCGAKRRDGSSCLSPAMPNGRCRMHGGKSTGARTEEGKARARRSNWRHGAYSAEARAERREAYAARAETIVWVKALQRLSPEAVAALVKMGEL